MFVFYYAVDDKIYFTCCRGAVPGRKSQVWDMPSASVWLIPNTGD